MQNEDQKAGPVVSGLVLLAAALFTANVYMSYSSEKQAVVYDEAGATYEQAASVMMSLRDTKNTVAAEATTTESVSNKETPVLQ